MSTIDPTTGKIPELVTQPASEALQVAPRLLPEVAGTEKFTYRTETLFGLPIASLSLAEAVQVCRQAISSREPLLIGVVNAAKIVNMRSDKLLDQSLRACNLILADGQSVVWASRILNRSLPERVTGVDLFESLLAEANSHGYAVFLLGATQQVMDAMTEVIAQRWPSIRIVGARNGYFTPEQDAEVARQIRASNADILFLGMSSPRKEKFLGYYAVSLQVPIMHGVGGSFDILAGKTKRAPLAWQRMGMEWAYRLLQEPRRMFARYLRTNIVFVGLTLAEWVRPQRPRTLDGDPR